MTGSGRGSRFVIAWGEQGHAEARSVPELDRVLDRIAAQQRALPELAEITSDAGASLLVGIGRAGSVVSFKSSPGPPYYASIGNPAAAGAVAYSYRGHWTEIARRHAVPLAVAREAARRFILTGARPENLAWEEV